MRVIELYSPYVHSVCYSLHVGAGSQTDGPDRPGVALLTQRVVSAAEAVARRMRAPHGRICDGGVVPGEAFIWVAGHRSREKEITALLPRFLRDPELTEGALAREKSMLWEFLPESPHGMADVSDFIYRLLMKDGLNWSVHGHRQSLESIDETDLRERFAKRWLSVDLVLSVAGAYSRSDVEWAADRLHEAIGGGELETRTAPAPDLLSPRRRIAVVPVDEDHFSLHLLFPGCLISDPESYRLSVLDCIVGDGPDSRVRQRLAWDLGLADVSGSTLWFLGDRIILEVYVEGSYERFRPIVAALVRSVESLLVEPPQLPEVQEAQTVLAFLRDYQLDDPQSAAPSRGSQYFASGLSDPAQFEALLIGEDNLHPDAVHETAQNVLAWDNLSILYIGPEPDVVQPILEETWPYKPLEVWELE